MKLGGQLSWGTGYKRHYANQPTRPFQPGEGPSRGLLRDCTTLPVDRLQLSVWSSGMWGPGLYGSGNRTLCNVGYWLSRLATFCQPNIFPDYTSWSAPIFPPRPSTQCARRWQIFIAVCLKIFSWVATLRVHIFGTGGRNSLAAQFKVLWFVTNLCWHFVVNCPSTQSANIKIFWTKDIS